MSSVSPGAHATLVHVTTVPMSLMFLRGQVGYMKRRGFDVHVVSSPGPELTAFADSEGVPFAAVPMQRRITPIQDLIAVARLIREFRRIDPRIVHAHTPKGGLLGMLAAWLCRTPVRLYHLRGLPVTGASGLRKVLLWFTEWLSCRLAHRVLCVSHSLRSEVIRLRLCANDKIKVLHRGSGNGVDAENHFNPDKIGASVGRETRSRLGIPQGAVVIGFVGRIVRDKGIVELSEAWRGLRADYPDTHLLIVGPFEPEDPVPANVRELLLGDERIHCVGVDWNPVPLYAAMDIVALPTYREGFPNILLEAAAMRLPVVATRVAGCVDAVDDGNTGALVAARNVAELRSALAVYIKDRDAGLRHGAAARERVLRDFKAEPIWDALYAEYTELLGWSDRAQDAGKAVEATI